MKLLPTLASLIILSGPLLGSANATTKTLPRGPAPKVFKTVDDHLFHVYVTPPKATRDYKPGKVVIMLKKEYPDYLYVSLTYRILAEGDLKAQIAIRPERVADYTVNVLDEQPDGKYLILYSESLSSIKRLTEKRAEQGGADKPATAAKAKSARKLKPKPEADRRSQ